MNFYYFSFFSLIPLLTIYAIGTALLAWIAYRLLRGKKGRWFIMMPLALLVYIGPIAEELWIAWNFGQLCRKDAGLFVYKTVEVEGFYDDTSGWGPRQLSESKYRFVESKDILYKTLSRVEQADNVSRDQALSWYLKNNPGKERPKDFFIVHLLNDRERISVSPNGVDAWRITKIDHPAARYHYTFPSNHTPVSYKVTKLEYLVVDSQTGEILARQTKYARQAYWFFISLSAPLILCPTPGERPHEERGRSLYNVVLKPVTAK